MTGEPMSRLQVELVRVLNGATVRDMTDAEILYMFGGSSRPLAEALRDVLADLLAAERDRDYEAWREREENR